MAAVKGRVAFAVERWGGSGAVFAWDLWNELGHHHGVETEAIDDRDGATAHRRRRRSSRRIVRGIERRLIRQDAPPDRQPLRRRAEGPAGRPDLPPSRPRFRHDARLRAGRDRLARRTPSAAADAMARWVRHALDQIRDGRPFTDSETGPIHTLQGPGDHPAGRLRPQLFPPHGLGPPRQRRGRRRDAMAEPAPAHPHARHAAGPGRDGRLRPADRLARTSPSRNVSRGARVEPEELLAYACADDRQAVAWVLRAREPARGRGGSAVPPAPDGGRARAAADGAGDVSGTCIETHLGHTLGESTIEVGGGPVAIALPPFRHDLAIAVRPGAALKPSV